MKRSAIHRQRTRKGQANKQRQPARSPAGLNPDVGQRPADQVSELLALQQTIGNRATVQLLAAQGPEPMLRYGSQSPAVKILQHYLVEAGADIAVDGIFGPITRQAVLAFQQEAGLAVDGIVGPQTWASLKIGGVTIDAESGGAGKFQQADLTDKVAAKLRAIAVILQTLPPAGGVPFGTKTTVSGAAPAGARHAGLASLIGGGASQAAAFSSGSTEPANFPAAGSPDGGSLVTAAADVLQAIQNLDPQTQSQFADEIAFVEQIAAQANEAPDSPLDPLVLTQLGTFFVELQTHAANQAGAATGTGFTNVDIVKDETYKIRADTIGGVGQELDNHSSIHGEAAHVIRQQASIRFVTNESKIVVRAELKFPLERELPEWTKADEVGKKCPCWKKEWDRFDQAIQAHEQQHVNLYKQFLVNLHAKCIGKTEDAADKVIDGVLEAVEKAQEKFDTTTDHGKNATPSTKFNAGISCDGCK
jgi:peptidoglycan hydrolase-like protein with peptidoglycan-binding domain/predicted secreted Zn-dependent protease